jgi:hypothetical protein
MKMEEKFTSEMLRLAKEYLEEEAKYGHHLTPHAIVAYKEGFEACYKLMISERDAQVSDTTDDDQGTKAGKQ